MVFREWKVEFDEDKMGKKVTVSRQVSYTKISID